MRTLIVLELLTLTALAMSVYGQQNGTEEQRVLNQTGCSWHGGAKLMPIEDLSIWWKYGPHSFLIVPSVPLSALFVGIPYPKLKQQCDVAPVPFTCDFFLGDFGTTPCQARCWHNDWEYRDQWSRSYGHYDCRWSFEPGFPMGGRCYCCDCCGGSGGRC